MVLGKFYYKSRHNANAMDGRLRAANGRGLNGLKLCLGDLSDEFKPSATRGFRVSRLLRYAHNDEM